MTVWILHNKSGGIISVWQSKPSMEDMIESYSRYLRIEPTEDFSVWVQYNTQLDAFEIQTSKS